MKFGTTAEGLGDTLLLTSVCKYLKNPTVQILKKNERFSILFQNICDVEITDDINDLSDIGSGHYSTRKLRNFFKHADALDNRPLVLYSDEESELWVSDFLSNIKRPIIFVPKCSKRWDSVRSLNHELCEAIIQEYRNKNLTPILVTNSSNDIDISNIYKLKDLDLKKYICLLRRVGRYVGCNTGDMHLAISVGCITHVFQPESNYGFNEQEWNYKHPSIIYFNKD
jgi:hypothetical protein